MSISRPMRNSLLVLVACGSATYVGWPALASTASRTAAEKLTCGAVVTHDVTLSRDILGCTGDGLVVAADGITVDLNGHNISGDAVAGVGRLDTGIVVDGRRHVHVTGGTVTGFDRGAALISSTDSRVAHVQFIGDSRAGISVRATSNSVVSDVVAQGSDFVGIFVTQDSHGIRVERSSVSENEQGISIANADDNLVEGNYVARNADNILVSGGHNRIRNNVITDAVGCGEDCGGYGISLEAGSDNLIDGNKVTNTVRDGIRISAFDPELPVVGNVVRENVVRGAGVDGIAVATTGEAAPPTRSVVERNTAVGSAGDGIHVAEPGAVVARNLATRNAKYGIEAVPGVVDGGSNSAALNGLTPPCIGVICS
jgi:parallel beta-helix repeat protein